MKRTLSLVLALIMVLGTFTSVFAAEATVEETAAKFLEKEGVLLGNDDGDLMLKNDLERRDAVVLLSRLLGVEDEAAEFLTTEDSPSWEDARTDAYYVPFFAWAEENGYFEGDDEGNFNPREAITAQEYALVLLRALDYDVKGHDAWKAALETAEELGLLKDVEVENKDEVVRGQMAVMTFNALGTKMNNSDETLAEKLGIEMPEDPKAKELTAEVNDTENLMEVVVELSNAELADELKLENASNYTLSGGRKVASAEIVEDDVVLLLEDALVRNREYTLTIKGIDRAINGEYKFDARDNAVPTVEAVEVLGEYGIKITTSEPVEEPEERNFLIDGKRVSMEVEQYGRDIIIRPYHERSFDKNASELEIIELEDYANYRSTSIKEEIEIIKDEVAPEIVKATMSNNKVTVEFDKDIYKPSVKKYESSRSLGNASYVERRSTFYAEKATKVDTNKVVYEFKEALPRNVEITVQDVQNHNKVAMEKTNVSPVLVTSDYETSITNNDKRQVLRVANDNEAGKPYAAALELVVEFDEEINPRSITSKIVNGERVWDNVTLYEKEVSTRGARAAEEVKIVSVYADEKELTVTFEGLRVNNDNKDYDYILEVNGLEDKNENRIFRDYIDFEVLHTASSFRIVREVEDKDGNMVKNLFVTKGRNNTEFEIAFSHEVDLDAALDAKNFIFRNAAGDEEDLDELDGYVIVERNGKTVTLVVPETLTDLEKDFSEIEISARVTRLNGDRLDRNDRIIKFNEFK
ncbi:MAG: hypothetical protein GX053_10590 [Tissierella sp.]|nr:hypothetical protein [Tissierella sp.]